MPRKPAQQQSLVLHRAGAADSRLLQQLARAFRRESGNSLSRTESIAIDTLLQDESAGAAFLIGVDGQVAGYIVLCFGFSLEYGGRDAFIDEFYLLPQARGAGVGASVMELVEIEAAQCGVHALHLEVLGDNQRVVDLYERCGFRDRGSRMMTKRIGS
ncbi:MAG: GNAT family N-acetyltransferase [Pseudomonadota bacterium]|nr:GNAT family N-acetyltransferase [Pseudomonadota bacterium]